MFNIVKGYSFNYSSRWLRNFKMTYNFKQYEVQGECGRKFQETIRHFINHILES